MTWRHLPLLLSDGCADDFPVSFGPERVEHFARFRAAVAGVAGQFRGCGRAALICADSHAFAIGLFGLMHAGTQVVLPANSQPATLDALNGAFDQLVDDAVIQATSASDQSLAPLDGEMTEIAFFTSGSTSEPKRVMRSLQMLDREVAVLEQMWGEALGNGPVMATVSHQHLYGLTFKLLWPLAAGRPFEAKTHAVWETVLAGFPPSAILVSSPSHLCRLEGIDPVPPHKRPAAIFAAGAPLSAKAARDTQAVFGCLPWEIFGSTETGAVATRTQVDGDESWTLLPGHRLLAHPEGQLVLHSPYSDAAVETADLVEPRPEGFRFIGRADRVAKIEGKRVGLGEVETALTALPWVDAAAVVVVPGQVSRLGAAVVLTAEGRGHLQQLGRFRFSRLLRHELAASQEPAGMPRLWRFVDSLPVRPLGKRRDADILALFPAEAQP